MFSYRFTNINGIPTLQYKGIDYVGDKGFEIFTKEVKDLVTNMNSTAQVFNLNEIPVDPNLIIEEVNIINSIYLQFDNILDSYAIKKYARIIV